MYIFDIILGLFCLFNHFDSFVSTNRLRICQSSCPLECRICCSFQVFWGQEGEIHFLCIYLIFHLKHWLYLTETDIPCPSAPGLIKQGCKRFRIRCLLKLWAPAYYSCINRKRSKKLPTNFFLAHDTSTYFFLDWEKAEFTLCCLNCISLECLNTSKQTAYSLPSLISKCTNLKAWTLQSHRATLVGRDPFFIIEFKAPVSSRISKIRLSRTVFNCYLSVSTDRGSTTSLSNVFLHTARPCYIICTLPSSRLMIT